MATITCEIEREGVLSKVVSANHEVQFVPAKIKYSGPEKVQPYFSNFIKQNDNGSYTTALRGRPLTGNIVEIPEDYSAFILKMDSSNRLSEKSEAKAHLVKRTSKVTVWNYDEQTETAANNPIANALKWAKLAKVMHGE